MLITGARHIEYMTSEGRQVPGVAGNVPILRWRSTPKPRQGPDWSDGDWAWLETPRKRGEKIKLKVRFNQNLDPGW